MSTAEINGATVGEETLVPFVDLGPMHAEVGEEIDAAIAATIGSGDFILGAEVDRFEDAFAAYCGVGHAIGVGSGTAALQIAVMALGIERGAEIVVPAHTYIASALGVLHAGAVPVFCDVDRRTGLIDADSAAAAVTDRTAAILAVHLYGQVCDPAPLRELARARGIALIEDAAQAHGASYGDERAGSVGDLAAFSFYPSKNLGAFGDAGCVTTDDAAVADLARRLRNLGQLGKGDHDVAGMNDRLDTLQAGILRAKLPHLDSWNESRREVAAGYRAQLPASLPILPERAGAVDVFHLFPTLVDDRDRVRAELGAAGIQTGIHYSRAVHEQPPFRGAERGEFPNAERWGREELSLPMFPGLDAASIGRVAEALSVATGLGVVAG
jgi:dTDP-4-amino-4,6-dideoxygalactose transaminase